MGEPARQVGNPHRRVLGLSKKAETARSYSSR